MAPLFMVINIFQLNLKPPNLQNLLEINMDFIYKKQSEAKIFKLDKFSMLMNG